VRPAAFIIPLLHLQNQSLHVAAFRKVEPHGEVEGLGGAGDDAGFAAGGGRSSGDGRFEIGQTVNLNSAGLEVLPAQGVGSP
jgi:hypothetical protein